MTLWIDKCAPRNTSELLVAKRKVNELRSYIEECIGTNIVKAIVVMGPPGSGKSSCIRCIASDLGLAIVSWKGASTENGSRVQDFAAFVSSCCKYSLLCRTKKRTRRSHKVKSRMLVIDENSLPNFTYSESAQEVFDGALRMIFSESLNVVVFEVTTHHEHESEFFKYLNRKFAAFAFSVVKFNPFPEKPLEKCIYNLCNAENLNLSKVAMNHYVESCRGDLSSLINAIQFDLGNEESSFSLKRTRKLRKRCERDLASDEAISAFHLMGRILHGKDMIDVSALLEKSDTRVIHVLDTLHSNFPFFEVKSSVEHVADLYEACSVSESLQCQFDQVSLGFTNDMSQIQKYALEIACGSVLLSRFNDAKSAGWRPVFASFSSSLRRLKLEKEDLVRSTIPHLMKYGGYDFLFRRQIFNKDILPYLFSILSNIPPWNSPSKSQRIVLETVTALNDLPSPSQTPLQASSQTKPQKVHSEPTFLTQQLHSFSLNLNRLNEESDEDQFDETEDDIESFSSE